MVGKPIQLEVEEPLLRFQILALELYTIFLSVENIRFDIFRVEEATIFVTESLSVTSFIDF